MYGKVMARNSNDLETETFTVSTNPLIVERLKALVQTGYYGKNHAEAAERLLARVLEERFSQAQGED